MRRRGGPPTRGNFDRPGYDGFRPPPSPPWEHRDPYGFPPSPPPPPGPHRGWYDRSLSPPAPPWRDDFDGPPRPPPPPPARHPPSSFADDDFDIPPPPPPPPFRGRGRGVDVWGAKRSRGGRGEARSRGISRGAPQTRGSMARGANTGRGANPAWRAVSLRGGSNATRGDFSASAVRGATRGAPGRGCAPSRGSNVSQGTTSRGAVNAVGLSTSNGSTNNWLARARGEDSKGTAENSGNQSTTTTTDAMNPFNQTYMTNSVAKNSDMNDKSYSMLNKAKKEQKKAQNAVVKAAVPGELNFISFKNSLQECCQKQQLPVPSYKVWKNSYGFSAKVEVAGNTFKSTGIQADHKEAQQSAAYNALLSLGLIDSKVSFDVKTAAVIKRPAVDNSIGHDVYGKRLKLDSASPVTTSYKSRLNEFCQKFRLSIPSYDTVKGDAGKGFITTIVFNKKVYQSSAPQPTKKLAEQNAAQVVLHTLNQCPAPAPSHRDFVEHCKKLTSQNESTASSETSTTPTSSTMSVAVNQIPLPTAPPTTQPVSTTTTSQSSTSLVQTPSTPIVEKITVPVNQQSFAAAKAKPQPTFTSHKNSLQEYCQKNKLALPVYSSTLENGVFTCTVQVAGKSFTSNGCNTKKGSEQTAANVALKALGLV